MSNDLGPVSIEGRLQAHWACQIPGALGALIKPAIDWSHTAMRWENDALWTDTAHLGDRRLRAGLRLESLTVELQEDGQQAQTLSLSGRTLSEGFDWLNETIRKNGPLEKRIERAELTLPKHPLENGEPFHTNEANALTALARWFGAAHDTLEAARRDIPNVRNVYHWPHHFDIAALVVLDPDKPFEDTRSIGLGLSPGDGNYAEPYWYVQPWPYPKVEQLPALEGDGTWHTKDFVSAVLPAARMKTVDQAARFLRSGYQGAAALIGG